jgi:hypothetical protein
VTAHIDPAPPRTPARTALTGFVQERLPFVIATGGEFLALYFWLSLWDAGSHILAVLVLWTGFLVERITVLGWVGRFHAEMEAKYPGLPPEASANDFRKKSKPAQFVHLLLITFSEIAIWVTAVFLFDLWGPAPALAVLLAGEQLQHSLELGLIAQRPITDYIPTWNAWKITLFEAIGGILWIWLVRHGQPQLGGLCLLIGLSIEHVVQGAKIKVDLEQGFKDRAAAAAAAPTPVAPAGG